MDIFPFCALMLQW